MSQLDWTIIVEEYVCPIQNTKMEILGRAERQAILLGVFARIISSSGKKFEPSTCARVNCTILGNLQTDVNTFWQLTSVSSLPPQGHHRQHFCLRFSQSAECSHDVRELPPLLAKGIPRVSRPPQSSLIPQTETMVQQNKQQRPRMNNNINETAFLTSPNRSNQSVKSVKSSIKLGSARGQI